MNALLSVDILSDYGDVITAAIKLNGRIISIISGEAAIVFKELTKLFECVKVLSNNSTRFVNSY